MNNIGLYIHIPFCVRKCAYCDFLSFPPEKMPDCDEKGENIVEKYIESLINEIKTGKFGENCVVDSIFIGGGTPSFISEDYIGKIAEALKGKFTIAGDCEWTIEGNPDSITYEKCLAYKSFGINRLSMGFQSLDGDTLKILGRVHTKERAIEAFLEARRAGFENINIDLIFGIPEEKTGNFEETLKNVVALSPEHISCYSLIVEEGTEICDKIRTKKLPEPDDGLDRQDYWFLTDFLKKNGFEHYEISNFAKFGKESRHNIKYWEEKEYLGFGLGAASFIGSRRFANTASFAEYIKNKGNAPLREDFLLSEEEIAGEFLMLGYRKIKGPDFDEFYRRFGYDAREKFSEKFVGLVGKGLLDENFLITKKGLDFANEIFMEWV